MATRTARQTIADALSRMGILSEEESPTAAQGVAALSVLNQLMQGFPAMGIPYVHAALTLDDVLNVPDEQTRNVMLMLVWELADGYGKALSPKILVDIADARNSLQACYYAVPPAEVDPALRNTLLHGSASITRL